VDFRYYKMVTIGDYVWNDLNANGIRTRRDGHPNVTLTLTARDRGHRSRHHQRQWLYLFTRPGTYAVTVDSSNTPARWPASPLRRRSRVRTEPWTATSTRAARPDGAGRRIERSDVDFGYYKMVTIGDYVVE